MGRQRTKNNAKPASSGRTAVLLTGGRTDSIITSLTGMNEPKEDTSFDLLFKKLGKKDATTRTKALQEFVKLIDTTDEDSLLTAFALWVPVYIVMTEDSNNKIREMAQVVLGHMAKKLKRKLAPYLKKIINAWFIGQFDPFPPAASAAAMSFSETFPEGKQGQALTTYYNHILDFICQQLFYYSSHKDNENDEGKTERMLSIFLLAYDSLITKVEESVTINNAVKHEDTVRNPIFWTLAKHESVIVKAAWYHLLRSLLHKAPVVLKDMEQKVIEHTLGNLDINVPTVIPSAWEAILLTLKIVKDWHTKINVNKIVLPKLWKLLQSGGYGMATTIYPNLLPLLKELADVTSDRTSFYKKFFSNLCLSLKHKTVITSKAQNAAVSKTFFECLNYVIVENLTDEPFCKQLLQDNLVSILRWCLLDNANSSIYVFQQTAVLLHYWIDRSSEKPKFFTYNEYFWDESHSLIVGLVAQFSSFDTDKISLVAQQIISFFSILREGAKSKEKMKVSFDTNASEPKKMNLVSSKQTPCDGVYKDALDKLVWKTCEKYFEIIELTETKAPTKCIENVFFLFKDFKLIGHKLCTDDFMSCVKTSLANWLKRDDLLCRSLIDFVFYVFLHLNNEEKKTIINLIDEVINTDCVQWCLETALSYPYNEDTLILQWLKSEKVSRIFIDTVDDILKNKCDSHLRVLLNLALTEDKNEEIYISQETVSVIVEKICDAMTQPQLNLEVLNTSASLACQIFAALYYQNMALKSIDLLITLIIGWCNLRGFVPEYISEETFYEMESTWKHGMEWAAETFLSDHLEILLEKIWNYILNSLTDKSFRDTMKVNVEALQIIFRSIYSVTNDIDPIERKIFSNDTISGWRNEISDICKIYNYVTGTLSSLHTIKVEDLSEKALIINFFTCWHLRMEILNSLLEDESDKPVSFIYSVLRSKIETIALLMYDVQLAKCLITYCVHESFTPHIRDDLDKFSEKIDSLKTRLTEEENNNLLDFCITKSLSESWLWCVCVYELWGNSMVVREKIQKRFGDDYGLTSLHYMQLFKECSYDFSFQCSFQHVDKILLTHARGLKVDDLTEVFEALRSVEVSHKIYYVYRGVETKLDLFTSTLETIRLFSHLIENNFSSLKLEHMKTIMSSLEQQIINISRIKDWKNDQALIISVLELYNICISKTQEMVSSSQCEALTDLWKDNFSDSINKTVISVCLEGANELGTPHVSLTLLPLLNKIASTISSFNFTLLIKNSPENSKAEREKLFETLISLLINQRTSIQISAYNVIIGLIPYFVEMDIPIVFMENLSDGKLHIMKFQDVFTKTKEIVNLLLMDIKLGEMTCKVLPFTDSYSYTLGYFLIWDLWLKLMANSPTEVKYEYSNWLKENEFVDDLCTNLFKIIPHEVCNPRSDLRWFSQPLLLHPEDPLQDTTIECMVCSIYASAIFQLPALIRQWWLNTEQKVSNIVENVTKVCVTPLLCSREYKGINLLSENFTNMKVKIKPSIREIATMYHADDTVVELIITLPPNYPLSCPILECPNQKGNTMDKLLKQFHKCVVHQVGSLSSGLSIWNTTLEKRFGAAEECCICFSILHAGTFKFPKQTCKTCKKKFHSACLYKWFSTSNKSSCPLCRNLF